MKNPDNVNFTLDTSDPVEVLRATEKARRARDGKDTHFVRVNVRLQAEYTFERLPIPEAVKDVAERFQLGFITPIEAVAQVMDRVSVDLMFATEVVDLFFPERAGQPRLDIERGNTDSITVTVEVPDEVYERRNLRDLDRWICEDETRHRRLRHVCFEVRPCIVDRRRTSPNPNPFSHVDES
jgi:hypothetical protein